MPVVPPVIKTTRVFIEFLSLESLLQRIASSNPPATLHWPRYGAMSVGFRIQSRRSSNLHRSTVRFHFAKEEDVRLVYVRLDDRGMDIRTSGIGPLWSHLRKRACLTA